MALKFAYWVPNVSGGLVISDIPQKTDWSFEANARYARIAEQAGFEYALLQTRFVGSYGAENQLEAITLAAALAAVTQKIRLITAILPGLWHPGVVAKMIATLDQISNGRAAVNIVSGWFKDEFHKYGQPWLDHDERYRRSEEFIRVLRSIGRRKKPPSRGLFTASGKRRSNPSPSHCRPFFKGGIPKRPSKWRRGFPIGIS
jgi:dimethylsulfone monooxygenase